MLPIDECLKLTDLSALRMQYRVRGKLISQMVGQLYPSILSGEMKRIADRYGELKYPRSPTSLRCRHALPRSKCLRCSPSTGAVDPGPEVGLGYSETCTDCGREPRYWRSEKDYCRRCYVKHKLKTVYPLTELEFDDIKAVFKGDLEATRKAIDLMRMEDLGAFAAFISEAFRD